MADLVDVYADASTGSVEGPAEGGDHRAHINEHRADIDAALMGALGFADSAADSFDRGGPYFVRAAGRSGTDHQVVRLLQPPTLLHVPSTTPRSRSESPRRSVETATRWRHSRARSRGCGESVHLSRQPAAGERQGRSRRSSRLLAEDLPRVVALRRIW